MNNKIILLDSNSLFHRAYHALPNLKTSKGMFTGAIFGFITILLRIIKEQKPTHIAAAFDLKAPTFRHQMFENYKGTRKPMDEELLQQLQPLKDLLDAMNIKIVSLEGYEADDILGTLAKRFDDDTIIVTGDRDSFQLVSESTRIFWTKKGVSEIEIYTPERLAEDGFSVASFIDYKALRGDPSDNIPGVKGVGEKTAKQLLDTYKTLENVLNNAANVKGKLGETLAESYDIAMLSRKLATIDCDVPVKCELDDIKFNPIFSIKVKNMLSDLEMPSLLNRMEFENGGENENLEENFEQEEYEKIEINTAQQLKNALKGEKIALYVDKTIKFSVDRKTEYSIIGKADLFSDGLDFDEALEIIKSNLDAKELICFDFKQLSLEYGLKCDKFFDLMIACHLARESATIKELSTVLNADGFEISTVSMLVAYESLKKSLKDKNLYKLFYEVEQPLAVVLRNMQERGFSVKTQTLKALEVEYAQKLNSLTDQIHNLAGVDFNIASPKQLGEVLFEKMNLPHGKKNKTGFSVSEDVLTKIFDIHPIIPLILEYRHFSKLQSTYVVGLQPLVKNGKIHTEFKQCITATGRLSSVNPNLQNIPDKGDDAKQIKNAFTASKDCILVSADYSQIELRLLAHFSEDQKLIEAYNRADDIHALTASQILNKPISEVTPQERKAAKAVNFGIIYGMSGFGLAENLSISRFKATEFINNYFEKYPTVKAYIESNIKIAKENGYAVTLLNRRRNLSDLNSSNYMVRSAAERMAMNTPLQGSAADIVKLAMLKVENRLKGLKSKMILQVHDELIVDTFKDEVDEIRHILKTEMENVVKLRVPLVVDVETAENWGEMK